MFIFICRRSGLLLRTAGMNIVCISLPKKKERNIQGQYKAG